MEKTGEKDGRSDLGKPVKAPTSINQHQYMVLFGFRKPPLPEGSVRLRDSRGPF